MRVRPDFDKLSSNLLRTRVGWQMKIHFDDIWDKPMAFHKPRTRLVNFRLTEEEYETLKNAAESRGARSISDFARAAILSSVATQDSNGNSAHASGIDRKLEDINTAVERLAGMLTMRSSGAA